MKHGLNSATVDRIRSVLARFSEVDKAILYGSRAKGTYKPGSDIDLALFGSDLDGSVLSRITSTLDDLLLPYKSICRSLQTFRILTCSATLSA